MKGQSVKGLARQSLTVLTAFRIERKFRAPSDQWLATQSRLLKTGKRNRTTSQQYLESACVSVQEVIRLIRPEQSH